MQSVQKYAVTIAPADTHLWIVPPLEELHHRACELKSLIAHPSEFDFISTFEPTHAVARQIELHRAVSPATKD
jgi:hypothetical protein